MITPSGRGPDGWYYDRAGADTFEVWADVAAHYQLEPVFTDIAGYSMGGYGTYKFASQFPDLFARPSRPSARPASACGCRPAEPQPGGDAVADRADARLGAQHPVPDLERDDRRARADRGRARTGRKRSTTLGYRYEFDQFQAGEHLTLAINDEYAPAAAFLGTDTVDRNPAHVTYVYNPTMDFPADGTTAGHAYWVYGVALRDGGGTAPLGTVDVRSRRLRPGRPGAVGPRRAAPAC